METNLLTTRPCVTANHEELRLIQAKVWTLTHILGLHHDGLVVFFSEVLHETDDRGRLNYDAFCFK